MRSDDTDLLILSMLQEDARISNAEIARRAGMVPSGILERLRKLERNNLIVGYETRLNWRLLGRGLLAFVFVRARERAGRKDTALRLAKIPEVQEVHSIAGEDCYLIKIRVSDPQELGRVLQNKVTAIRSVLATKTTIVLDTLKETTAIPVGNVDEEPDRNQRR